MGDKLKLSWYQTDDVANLSKLLLGKVLCTNIDGIVTKGKIVETEAYSGFNDKASHANGHKKTKRNAVMFGPGGHAYVYLCYGIHHLFNVVTNVKGSAEAVLIRAIEPIDGIEMMMQRRNMHRPEKRLTAGPGVLSQALGIQTNLYGEALDGEKVWIENNDEIDVPLIVTTTRIGVEYAEEDALKPWRFYIKENPWVSRL